MKGGSKVSVKTSLPNFPQSLCLFKGRPLSVQQQMMQQSRQLDPNLLVKQQTPPSQQQSLHQPAMKSFLENVMPHPTPELQKGPSPINAFSNFPIGGFLLGQSIGLVLGDHKLSSCFLTCPVFLSWAPRGSLAAPSLSGHTSSSISLSPYFRNVSLCSRKLHIPRSPCPGGAVVRIHLPAQEMQETWFDPWVRKIPWRRKWQPTSVLLPGKSHGQRSLVGCGPWGQRESDARLKWVNITYISFFKTQISSL